MVSILHACMQYVAGPLCLCGPKVHQLIPYCGRKNASRKKRMFASTVNAERS